LCGSACTRYNKRGKAWTAQMASVCGDRLGRPSGFSIFIPVKWVKDACPACRILIIAFLAV